MSLRVTVRDAAHRAFLMVTRGTLKRADDKHLMQEVEIDMYGEEAKTKVERFQPYGLTSVPHKEDKRDKKKPAEVVIAFVEGVRSHPIVILIDDRRYRLQALEDGEIALHDDQTQQVHITRAGVEVSVPKDKKIFAAIMPKKAEDYVKEGAQDSSGGDSGGGGGGGDAGGGGQQEKYGQKAHTKEDKRHATRVLDQDQYKLKHPKLIKNLLCEDDKEDSAHGQTKMTPDLFKGNHEKKWTWGLAKGDEEPESYVEMTAGQLLAKHKAKVKLEAPLIVLQGIVKLGDESASREVSARDTLDTEGNADVANLLTKVYGI